MPVICIGPVCVPLNMFLPFLLGILHRYGWFNWIKKEWVTFRYWKKRFLVWYNGEQDQQPGGAASAATMSNGGGGMPEGAVCTADGCCYLPEQTAGEGVPVKTPNMEAAPNIRQRPGAAVAEAAAPVVPVAAS